MTGLNPLSALFGVAGVAANAIFGKKPKPAAPPPILGNDPVASAVQASDELRRRRGGAANDRTGGGAEAVTPGARALFGQGG